MGLKLTEVDHSLSLSHKSTSLKLAEKVCRFSLVHDGVALSLPIRRTTLALSRVQPRVNLTVKKTTLKIVSVGVQGPPGPDGAGAGDQQVFIGALPAVAYPAVGFEELAGYPGLYTESVNVP